MDFETMIVGDREILMEVDRDNGYFTIRQIKKIDNRYYIEEEKQIKKVISNEDFIKIRTFILVLNILVSEEAKGFINEINNKIKKEMFKDDLESLDELFEMTEILLDDKAIEVLKEFKKIIF